MGKLRNVMNNYKILFPVYFFMTLLFTSCCSIIGFGIGTAIDNKNSDEYFTINEVLFEITPETEVKLVTISNDTITGYYKSTNNSYSDDYIEEYNNRYDDLNTQISIPKLGDTLLIANPKGEIYKYIFLGFDFKKIFVKSALSNQKRFIKFIPEMKIKQMNGQYLNYTFINNGIEFKLIPIMSKMRLENKSGSQSVFYHNIHKILTESSNKAKYLTLIGLSIDLFLWYNLEDSWGFGGGKMWKWE
jgi:hypothetical protein